MLRRTFPSLLAIVLVVLVTAVVSVQGLWIGERGDGWKGVVRSDVKGYYGYLQSIFIRGDLGEEPFVWEYVRYTADGQTVNKYFCGTSVMMAPWFGIGHALALGDPEAPKDGLSIHEMRALSIGGWVYLLVGLLALRALLLGLGVRDGVVAWTLLAFGGGTQLIVRRLATRLVTHPFILRGERVPAGGAPHPPGGLTVVVGGRGRTTWAHRADPARERTSGAGPARGGRT